MMRVQNYSLDQIEDQMMAYLYCQYNLCELFSCPIGLNPKSANVSIKQKLVEKNIRYQTDQTQFNARNNREYRLVPSKRLITRLGLHDFDKPAPMTEVTIKPEIVHIAKIVYHQTSL